MNQLVKSSKLDEYRAQVLPPERARDLYTSLPSHIKPAVFERNLVNALMANPSLMDYDPRLIFREVSKAAGLGLLLDPLLGEGYIVTAYNYKTKKTEPQLRVGYKGMNKLARQTGNVAGIYAHEVHALDDVECDLGFPKVFHHKPKLFVDRGPIVGYVALVAYKDATFDFEPMSLEQCLGIRDRSDAWKAYRAEKIKTTPWASDESEMCKKTVLRRLMKRQDQSPELVRAFQIEDEAEQIDIHSALPEIPRQRVPSPSEVEDHGSDKYAPGDVVSLIAGGDGATAIAGSTLGKVGTFSELHKDDPISTGRQKMPSAYGLPDLSQDYDAFFNACLDKINTSQDGGELETFWNAEIESQKEMLMPPDLTELAVAYGMKQTKLNADSE